MDNENANSESRSSLKTKCLAKLERTVEPIFLCYVVAYMMQTALVENYIQETLTNEYNVSKCESDCKDNEGSNEEANEMYENDLKHYSIYLVKIYAVSAFVLAPFMASYSDGVNRIYLLFICNLFMAVSALATPIMIAKSYSIDSVIWWSNPPNFTGGLILFTVLIFSNETNRNSGFKLFEKYLELTALYVSGKAICQLIVTLSIPSDDPPPLKNNGIIYVPLGFIAAGFFWLIINFKRIKDNREMPNQTFGQSLLKIIPLDYVHFFKCPLFLFLSLLSVCGFFFYFDYVGETLEVITMVNEKEPWQVSSVSLQGAAQSIAQGIEMGIAVYFFKRVVHKRIVDKRLLHKVSLSYLGILALAVDFLTKCIVSAIPSDNTSVQLWVPLIGVISELAIVVIRFFAVLLVPKDDAAKSLSLLAWAQILAIVPGPYMVQTVADWSEQFWANFIYVFMALLLIIPAILLWIVGKFGSLPDLVHQLNPEEEEEQKSKRGRRFRQNKNYNTDVITVIT